MIIMDTSAWVENFEGSILGKIVEEYLNKESIITPSIVLVELSCKSIKENWDFEKVLRYIKSKSSIIGINEKIILEVGKIYHEIRGDKSSFGMIDAIILTTAKEFNAKILTKDNDFRDLNEAIIIK